MCSKGKHGLLSNIKIINNVCLNHISVYSVNAKCCYFSTMSYNKLKQNLNIALIGSKFKNGFHSYVSLFLGVYLVEKWYSYPLDKCSWNCYSYILHFNTCLFPFLLKMWYALKSGCIWKGENAYQKQIKDFVKEHWSIPSRVSLHKADLEKLVSRIYFQMKPLSMLRLLFMT